MIKMVCVGIDRYAMPYVPPLSGCVADALDIRLMFKNLYGLDNDAIHMLTNERATSQNILDRLNYAADNMGQEDILIFYRACHGSQMRDRRTDSSPEDELDDHLDEIVICHDYRHDRPSGYISDDDLAKIVTKVSSKGALMIDVADTCHSGTSTRSFGTIERYLPPHLDIALRAEGLELGFKPPAASRGSSLSTIALAATAPHQTAKELPQRGVTRGAFTFHLVQQLSQEPELPLERLVLALQNLGVNDQTPQLEAPEKFRTMSLAALLKRGGREKVPF